jgi:hypothetical protein
LFAYVAYFTASGKKVFGRVCRKRKDKEYIILKYYDKIFKRSYGASLVSGSGEAGRCPAE